MDIRWLQDFLTLAEVRNFTKAAEIRNLSQAAFSRRIQALEQWLEVKLTDRNTYPTTLTDAGERFRATAAEVIAKISEVRAELSPPFGRNHIRIALPYSVATTKLPTWWKSWTSEHPFTCSLEPGNIHDTVSALSADVVDLWIGFYHPAQPIPINQDRYERMLLGTEYIKPYMARSEYESGRIQMPGTLSKPVPLLMYSQTAYFSRIVNTAMEDASEKMYGNCVFESEMSDVLGDLASQGLGVAWLSDGTIQANRDWDLMALGNGMWDLELTLFAYKAKNNPHPGIEKLWKEIMKRVPDQLSTTVP
ncbi:MAG: LysR family transcriptional regulator [Pseudomonadota bacterium]